MPMQYRFDPGPSSSPIWIENLHCIPLYADCWHNGYGNVANCSHSKDLAISCLAEGAVRLSYWDRFTYPDDPGAPVGLLEIYHNGKWGTVDHSGFDQLDADIVCRQLGYSDRADKYGNVTVIG